MIKLDIICIENINYGRFHIWLLFQRSFLFSFVCLSGLLLLNGFRHVLLLIHFLLSMHTRQKYMYIFYFLLKWIYFNVAGNGSMVVLLLLSLGFPLQEFLHPFLTSV